jgi:hypothetical protein
VIGDGENAKDSTEAGNNGVARPFTRRVGGGVLEVYNVIRCSDYPNNPNGISGGSHSISFNAIALFDDKIQQIANPAWSLTLWATGLTPQCSYGGSVPNQVILKYGPGAPTASGAVATQAP